jgi:hypothetical protein
MEPESLVLKLAFTGYSPAAVLMLPHGEGIGHLPPYPILMRTLVLGVKILLGTNNMKSVVATNTRFSSSDASS